MYIFLFILIVIVFSLWILAEFKANKILRITLGIIAISLIAYFTFLAVSVIPSYERQFNKSNLKKIEDYLKNDEITIVINSISKYNKIIEENNNYYKASMELWESLNKDEKN